MGTWFVIATIPTRPERDAYAATEHYERRADGAIATTFTFRKGSLEGPVKTMRPVGFIKDESGAYWGMQFIWPFKAENRIVYLSDDYSQVIVARTKRDYVWVMARTSHLPEQALASLIDRVAAMGYDTKKLRLVPQP
jgi:apolipoprotein D and lipocalin family protein